MSGINNKKNVLNGLLWKFMERGGTQGVQLLVQIILARLLIPKDFGIIVIVSIFIELGNTIVQSGGTATVFFTGS